MTSYFQNSSSTSFLKPLCPVDSGGDNKQASVMTENTPSPSDSDDFEILRPITPDYDEGVSHIC
jgi:hypothetical protein